MAVRPWVSPIQVKEYTDYSSVKDRSDKKLEIDISRAEQVIISYTNNNFSDASKYPQIPEAVKTAVILLAEAYGCQAALGDKRNKKSEAFDDYSYTIQDGPISVESLDLGPLLEEFALAKAKNGVTMRLRGL